MRDEELLQRLLTMTKDIYGCGDNAAAAFLMNMQTNYSDNLWRMLLENPEFIILHREDWEQFQAARS